MGARLLDQYSLLHFAAGVVAYFWGVPLWWWVAIHFVFELTENTVAGMALINRFPVWPGGKPRADAPANMVGDHVAAIVGWGVAAALDRVLGNPY